VAKAATEASFEITVKWSPDSPPPAAEKTS